MIRPNTEEFEWLVSSLLSSGYVLDGADVHGVVTYSRDTGTHRYRVKLSPTDAKVYGFIYNDRMGTSSYDCLIEDVRRNNVGWLQRKLRERLYDNCRYY